MHLEKLSCSLATQGGQNSKLLFMVVQKPAVRSRPVGIIDLLQCCLFQIFRQQIMPCGKQRALKTLLTHITVV